jgi:hypothetical protein
MVSMGTAQRPKLNGPGIKLRLPVVMRRKIGTTYEM